MPNKINEPNRTGVIIKIGDASSKTPSNATAPAGGCKHLKAWPRAIANPTAMPLAKGDDPKKNTQKTADIAPIKFPKTRFLGWAKGLLGAPNKRTVEAPKGAISRE